ncbi:MAG: hypothetical protein JRE65_06850 [Deltaproteobacteria bacterium]|jgi:hypothetical protein|nr:hypothetical protein [Deltaproteobacteria bacterium]
MKKEDAVFVDENEFFEMSEVLETWENDAQKIKQTFLKVIDKLSTIEGTRLNFISRPGVSYSLRASLKNHPGKRQSLYALVDIIDDDPDNRWLSICFYEEAVTDPDGLGNLVPKGILGEDGYCFDIYEHDPFLTSYVERRVEEAYMNTLKFS